MLPSLAALEPDLDVMPGRVSVWCGPPGGPAWFARLPEERHDAASTMKLAVLVAAYRGADRGHVDLSASVRVHDDFASRATAGGGYQLDRQEDADQETWSRMGERLALGRLLERMVTRSGNLAANLVLEYVGFDAVADSWRACGATDSVVGRMLGDYAAREEGIQNLVTAADLAAVLGAVTTERAASPEACAAMRRLLAANEHNPDIPAGLPEGTPVAHKNGWIDGIRHDAAIVGADDPYLLVVCTSTDLDDAAACDLVAEIAAASWRDRAAVS